MYDDSIKLVEIPDHDSISVCVYIEQDGLFALGERINGRFAEAYMNGYNWDALVRFYVGKEDPDLMQEVETDPEAGMFSAHMSYSADNMKKMKRFESHIRKLVSDEKALLELIEQNREAIAWD